MSRSRTSPEALPPHLKIVMAAPSGAGKSTVARRLFQLEPRVAFSVSHTTRPPRPGEVDGVHYHFVDDATFDAMVAEGGFAEWAHVHTRRYGTSHSSIADLATRGFDILFDVDVQGAWSLREAYADAVTVFVAPPSMTELARRLRGRGTEGEDQLRVRLENGHKEMRQVGWFDYVIFNEDVELAARQFVAIVQAERLRRARNLPRLERAFPGLEPIDALDFE